MNLLVDIKHPAEVNLFKILFQKLRASGCTITICFLDKGKLSKIVEKEFSDYTLIRVGSSESTKWSIIWNGNITRVPDFIHIIRNKKIDICLAASSAPLAFAGFVTGTPVIQFYDDPERKGINKVNEYLSSKIFFPPIVNPTKKIGVFNCLKEWSYLSPAYFYPDPTVLIKYKVEARKYVFVREINNKSFNYFHQKRGIIQGFSTKLDHRITYLVSLEDIELIENYPTNWIILKEPVEDIHSLIYYSKLMISSGDSMAREGSLLGIPSVYCGIRNMKANELLIKKGLLKQLPDESAIEFILKNISGPFEPNRQTHIREKLFSEWDDMNDFMIGQINHYTKNPAN